MCCRAVTPPLVGASGRRDRIRPLVTRHRNAIIILYKFKHCRPLGGSSLLSHRELSATGHITPLQLESRQLGDLQG